MSRRNRGRKAVPPSVPLLVLERELHAAPVGESWRADEDEGGRANCLSAGVRELILAYVAANPGALAREVIAYGRGYLTRTEAERVIEEMLTGEPRQLRTDHPAGRGYGHSHERLYIIGADPIPPG